MINVGSNDLIAFGNGIFFNQFTKYPAMIPAIDHYLKTASHYKAPAIGAAEKLSVGNAEEVLWSAQKNVGTGVITERGDAIITQIMER